jgi:hypothetical protein
VDGGNNSSISSAKIAVLLVSQHFVASDFIVNVELPQLVKASQAEELRIIWIAVGHCLYRETVLKEFQAANNPSRPLNAMSSAEADRQLVAIAERIQSILHSDLKAETGTDRSPGKPWYGASGQDRATSFLRTSLYPTLSAAVLTLLTGTLFRLWHEEARLNITEYLLVFVIYLLIFTVMKRLWRLGPFKKKERGKK